MEKNFDVTKHIFVPQHLKLNEEEKKAILDQYNISLTQLPKIRKSDPAIQSLDPKTGDVIKIIRKGQTNTETDFYRVVVHG